MLLAMDAWAPVAQTLAWIIFLGIVLHRGAARLGSIADAFRERIAKGAGVKASAGPRGLDFELSQDNSSLTPVAPPGSSTGDSSPKSLPEWTHQREEMGRTQRGVHLAHTLAPSSKPGQAFDLYVYLVGWGRDRFEKPNDLSDVTSAEFYLGPAWNDRVVTVSGGQSKVGFRTSAYAPALCICRVTFSDGATAILSRYLDFEMGRAIGATAWSK